MIEVCRLALAGFFAEAGQLDATALRRSRAAIAAIFATTKAARGKLLQARNARALTRSLEQLASAIGDLPGQCHVCQARNYYSCHDREVQMDYLQSCQGIDTFDCALSLMRRRMSPCAGPLVAPMPRIAPPLKTEN